MGGGSENNVGLTLSVHFSNFDSPLRQSIGEGFTEAVDLNTDLFLLVIFVFRITFQTVQASNATFITLTHMGTKRRMFIT